MPPPPREESWPSAVIELSARPSATRVTVRPSRVDISNEALVRTWPPAALELAREAPEALDMRSRHPAWPRLALRLERPGDDDLVLALETARRAERASTGAGTGAGVVDLRVATDVPFGQLSRTLLAAGRAGYGQTRLLLDGAETTDGSEPEALVFEWRGRTSDAPERNAPSNAPSLEEIQAAMDAIARGEPTHLEPPSSPVSGGQGARVTASLDENGQMRLQVHVAGELIGGPCELERPSMTPACIRSLDVSGITLEVDGHVPFGAVCPYWQHLSLLTDAFAIHSR